MKMYVNGHTSGIGIFALLAVIMLPLSFLGSLNAQPSNIPDSGCTSGKLSANLTGWMMNEEMPKGSAGFDSAKNQLTVTVESVKLPDGTRLEVLIGDKKIGELTGLAKGESKGEITLDKNLAEGDRVRVLHDKVPVVSGNLVCEKAQ